MEKPEIKVTSRTLSKFNRKARGSRSRTVYDAECGKFFIQGANSASEARKAVTKMLNDAKLPENNTAPLAADPRCTLVFTGDDFWSFTIRANQPLKSSSAHFAAKGVVEALLKMIEWYADHEDCNEWLKFAAHAYALPEPKSIREQQVAYLIATEQPS